MADKKHLLFIKFNKLVKQTMVKYFMIDKKYAIEMYDLMNDTPFIVKANVF